MVGMKDYCMEGKWVEVGEVGINLFVKGLCVKLKSLNYSLKIKGKLLKIFK